MVFYASWRSFCELTAETNVCKVSRMHIGDVLTQQSRKVLKIVMLCSPVFTRQCSVAGS